jgi:hypothetical protein
LNFPIAEPFDRVVQVTLCCAGRAALLQLGTRAVSEVRRKVRISLTKRLSRAEDSTIELKRIPKMGLQTTFHAPVGGDFLGFRKNRAGATEIVYEDLAAHRMVFRVAGQTARDDDVAAALSVAVGCSHVLPSLFDELKKRAIAIERVIG